VGYAKLELIRLTLSHGLPTPTLAAHQLPPESEVTSGRGTALLGKLSGACLISSNEGECSSNVDMLDKGDITSIVDLNNGRSRATLVASKPKVRTRAGTWPGMDGNKSGGIRSHGRFRSFRG
jgi:hypothetical protein